ncbi:purine nucleoside permease [Piedraia hortae CBS 480.64]|uniref:Purine nucleoside permease n=1 Tax=Piedraia hortae CBS 480.64 TaxID=1314780 RepID=A0A6A7BWK7_9PEZI|nr:purine nucleoside permease [Piedraia hortae CBS 480.64]
MLPFFLCLLALLSLSQAHPPPSPYHGNLTHYPGRVITPKVIIISMFAPEAEAWYSIPEFNLLAHNVTLPGLSPLFPSIHCEASLQICQLITGEGEINAASSLSALVLSPLFDLQSTYFLIAGIAGINPEVAPTCSVTFARYAVQVALQYEFSTQELNSSDGSGYIPLGARRPYTYPKDIYGTEVFELNAALQRIAATYARTATLADSAVAKSYRAHYVGSAGASAPGVYECDVATSDVYYSGKVLSDSFAHFARILTNGSAVYCSTAQEDNASLEALIRASRAGKLDFSRIIVMRTASDYDRPYPGQAAEDNLFADQGAFRPSVENIYRAGIKIVEGIVGKWEGRFAEGVKAENYVGDIFATLGGQPDFGPGARTLPSLRKRGIGGRGRRVVF